MIWLSHRPVFLSVPFYSRTFVFLLLHAFPLFTHTTFKDKRLKKTISLPSNIAANTNIQRTIKHATIALNAHLNIMDNFDSFEVVEPLTRRVAGILQDYPDGTQIARELLQNSEDACSTEQWYLLDHHHHPANPERLFDPGMQAYQGPALLAGNDSLFEQDDFKSLRNLAESGKKDDERKIGQMGIGFNRFVFHFSHCRHLLFIHLILALIRLMSSKISHLFYH